MVITWKDEEYNFDIDDLTVAQAKVIKAHCGLTLMGLVEALRVGDPDGLRAAFWLMHAQSGKGCNIDTVDFKIVDFLNAITAASKAEADALAANAEESPKDET
jgi:hypothetical protein